MADLKQVHYPHPDLSSADATSNRVASPYLVLKPEPSLECGS